MKLSVFKKMCDFINDHFWIILILFMLCIIGYRHFYGSDSTSGVDNPLSGYEQIESTKRENIGRIEDIQESITNTEGTVRELSDLNQQSTSTTERISDSIGRIEDCGAEARVLIKESQSRIERLLGGDGEEG